MVTLSHATAGQGSVHCHVNMNMVAWVMSEGTKAWENGFRTG